MRALTILFVALALSACSTVSSWFSENPDHPNEITQSSDEGRKVSSVPVKASSPEELELRIARLSSRIDELETQLVQQKERSKLLEKGLLLGLVPDELKSEGIAEARKPQAPHANEKSSTSLSAVKLLEVKTPEIVKNEGNQDRDLYRKKLQEAQDKFNRANYGQAISAYNEIGAKFDDSITEGSQHYWIGLSWFYLKEFKLAEESFQTLRSRYPGSPWSQHAEFYLAKVDLSRGFHQRALEQFQKILDENPSRDLGEMAQAEIERMREKL